jgi:hypothetical protein
MRNSRFLACFVASAAINVGVISVVGRSRLLSHETPTVEEVLNPIPVNTYKPRPLIASPTPTPTPLPQLASAPGSAKSGVQVPPLRRASSPPRANATSAANTGSGGGGTGAGNDSNRSGSSSGREGDAPSSSGESAAAQGTETSGGDSSRRASGGDGREGRRQRQRR